MNIVELLTIKNKTIATMESCTGGGLANFITNIEGASDVLRFSAVTYSNEYKIKMGVNKETIEKYTVYSIEVAKEMSKSISLFSNSSYGVGITGKINRADKNNITDNDSIVYVSIYDKEKDNYYTLTIEPFVGTRKDNKDMIIEKIVRFLSTII